MYKSTKFKTAKLSILIMLKNLETSTYSKNPMVWEHAIPAIDYDAILINFGCQSLIVKFQFPTSLQ
jgi:hypothetical protein